MIIEPGSVVVGLLILPACAFLWWLLSQAKRALLVAVHRGQPATVKRRARMAARVYAARRVLLIQCFDLAVAVTVGHSYADQQRATVALLSEFTPQPASAPRSHW